MAQIPYIELLFLNLNYTLNLLNLLITHDFRKRRLKIQELLNNTEFHYIF